MGRMHGGVLTAIGVADGRLDPVEAAKEVMITQWRYQFDNWEQSDTFMSSALAAFRLMPRLNLVAEVLKKSGIRRLTLQRHISELAT
jgi:hypothetical protein